MTKPPFATGSCRCGQFSYEISAAPTFMVQCHCRDCQKMSGTGHMSIAFFKEGDVACSGETSSFAVTTDSGNESTRHFCPTCGSRLYGVNSGRPGIVTVPVGTLDDSSWFRPERVIYTKHQKDWDITSEDLPRFEVTPQRSS